MDHEEASEFTMPIGKYKDSTLSEIEHEENDLDYLVWLKDGRDSDEEHEPDELDEALEAYLE